MDREALQKALKEVDQQNQHLREMQDSLHQLLREARNKRNDLDKMMDDASRNVAKLDKGGKKLHKQAPLPIPASCKSYPKPLEIENVDLEGRSSYISPPKKNPENNNKNPNKIATTTSCQSDVSDVVMNDSDNDKFHTLPSTLPLETFNPVKTVNDLLKTAHQPSDE